MNEKILVADDDRNIAALLRLYLVKEGFDVRIAGDGDAAPILKLLQGPYPDAQVEGWSGATASQHGFPRFRHAEFDAAYPFGQVHLSDPDVPVNVTLQAFNPLIPADADASGFPVAVLRYVVRNLTDHALDVSVCGTVSNCTGADTPEQAWQNDQRTADGLVGLVCSSTNPEVRHTPTEGEVVLATPQESGHITCRTDWLKHSWGFSLLDFWDDFEADGDLDPRQGPTKWPKASLCVRRRRDRRHLPPRLALPQPPHLDAAPAGPATGHRPRP